ncbi:MAG TPA: TetR/AcrR family transcriptional regulator [Rhodobacteraceae bacterium]|jgi:AcrR family transcriptional regulator|nr:TetR/AcrR family transcriptional regulator [Paracoccaceae bacterium]
MVDSTAQIKKGRKYDQVLEGARAVFMKHGFEGASVDDIAKTAAVSKATLYSYFPDKRLLFAEVAKVECIRQADTAVEMVSEDSTPAQVLHDAGQRMIGFFTSEFGISMHRTCVAESCRFPELGRHFYQSGPLLVRQRMVEYFQEAVEKGQLDIADFDLAADQFAELCKVSYLPSLLCGVQTSFTRKETDRVLNGAVEMFMARYGV